MLTEKGATAFLYAADTDLATVRVETEGVGQTRSHEVDAQLLLDSAGFLVGIDCRDKAGRGVVVMLGPHEAVAEIRAARVVIDEAASGPQNVRIPGARTAIRGGDKNPYV
jgi:hypothetical protein